MVVECTILQYKPQFTLSGYRVTRVLPVHLNLNLYANLYANLAFNMNKIKKGLIQLTECLILDFKSDHVIIHCNVNDQFNLQ